MCYQPKEIRTSNTLLRDVGVLKIALTISLLNWLWTRFPGVK